MERVPDKRWPITTAVERGTNWTSRVVLRYALSSLVCHAAGDGIATKIIGFVNISTTTPAGLPVTLSGNDFPNHVALDVRQASV